MNIKEFWETENLCAIHCNTMQKAKKLLRIFTLMGKTWERDNIPYTQSGWNFFKEYTCYDNKRSFGQIATYKIAKATIIEFDDLDEFKPYEIKSDEPRPTMLTTRAWKTYNLIKKNSIQGQWTSKKDIVKNDRFDPMTNPLGYIMNDRQHDVCSGIWEDVDMINSCPEIDKIVISNGKGFKLATNNDEASDYINAFKNKAIKALIRYSNLKHKIKANGQGKLLTNRLDPIEESKAREFIETFINEQ